MELELYRLDLLQTGTSAKGTLAVLPLGDEKKTQRVAVGDLQGVIQAVGLKEKEVAVTFKTLPAPNEKVTSLVLGRGRAQKDRIFAASGSAIKGLSKHGKEFFKFNTQLTEKISKLDIYEKNIWVSGEFVHNHYLEGKDRSLYLAPDKIIDAEVVPILSPTELCPVLANKDRHIRVLQGNEVYYEVATASAPTSVKYVPESHDPLGRFPQAKELLYATETGTLVQLLLDSSSARQGFVIDNPKKLAAVRSIFSGIDFTKTGSNDIVVGREDGVIEVYEVDENGQVLQVYNTKLTESINAIEGGYVTSPNAQEFVLQTFSGKVISYAPQGGGLLLSGFTGDKPGSNITSYTGTVRNEDQERKAAYTVQIQRMKVELEGIKRELENERAKFMVRGGDTVMLAAAAPFSVQDRLRLQADEACYVLQIESSVPIFCVAIQCSAKLQLLDVPSNVAILSRSPADANNGNMTLATYRCQDSTSRLSVKFKVREGRTSQLNAFVIPQISPKACVQLKHTIKPLCLHHRLREIDENRPMNEVIITGTFDITDMHGWVNQLLPDVPPTSSVQGECILYYQNALLGTQLACRYHSGEARFQSDLISTLGIIHELVMREATAAKHRVSVEFRPSARSLQYSVALVWPLLESQRQLQKKYALLEGLQELKMQDNDIMNYLSPEYKSVLENMEQIRQAYKEQPQHLEHIVSLVKDLYTDFCKLSGTTVPKQRLPALEQMLQDTHSTLEQVTEFVMGKA